MLVPEKDHFKRLTRCTLLSLSLRKKIGSCLSIPPGQDFRTALFEGVYEGTTGNKIDDKIFLYGTHEPATLRLLRNIICAQLAEGLTTTYMDIGTNTGHHLIAVGLLAYQTYGFEPWDPVLKKAQNNIALNRLSHTHIFNFGLSDINTNLPFISPQQNNWGLGSFENDSPATKPTETLSLPVRVGDDVVAEHNIIPTLIKIDVEGHERKVLKGLSKTLRLHKPTIVFECSPGFSKDLGREDVRQNFFGPEYKLYGLRRSQEFPVLVSFQPNKRYENILAWPNTRKPLPWKTLQDKGF